MSTTLVEHVQHDAVRVPFPEPRFPSGVGVGPTALVLILVAGAVALALTGVGVPAAVLLLVVALVAYPVLRATLVTPVRLLRDRLADPGFDPGRFGVGELDRIAGVRGARRAPSVAAGPAVVAVALVAWAASTGLALAATPPAAPGAEAEGRAALAATVEDLRGELRDGVTAVGAVASPRTGAALTDPAAAPAQLLAPPFRAVRVVDPDGRTVAAAGPVTASGWRPPTEPVVEQLNTAGPEPLVVASAPMWDGRHTVIAEFDPRRLGAVLQAPGRHTRVVDDGLRAVLDSAGFVAFTPLTDPAVAQLARDAVRGAEAVVVPDTGDGRTAAAARLGDPSSPLDPGWVVVQDQDVDAAAFAGDPGRRAAAVAVGLTAGLAAIILAWTVITVVGPLRALARHVESGSATPFAPRRLDEIGAIAAAVNRR